MESEGQTVYLVADGIYSDYRVYAVFTTRDKAQAWMDAWGMKQGEEDCRIEESDLDPVFRVVPEGYGLYWVKMTLDGDHSWPDGSDPHDSPEWPQHLGMRSSWGRWYEKNVLVGGDIVEGYVLAHDAQHAIKIANEQRAMLIAQGVADAGK